MLEMAQEMFKAIQDRFRTTMRVVADLAESVGVPSTVTTLFTGEQRADCACEDSWARPPRREAAPVEATVVDAEPPDAEPPDAEAGTHETDTHEGASKPASSHRRANDVRGLRVDDAVSGSTYLARIIWSLGVAALEGAGPQRPADMARMIMSRSAVSLEPPNVARYIRRSKPTCIEVGRTEGSSSYYQLNTEGTALFEALFRNKK